MEINFNNHKSYLLIIEDFVENMLGDEINKIIKEFGASQFHWDYFHEKLLVNYEYVFHDNNRIDFVLSNFESIKGFHATKQIDINRILEEGLKTFSYADYLKTSLTHFEKVATKKKIENVVQNYQDRIDRMRINLYSSKDFQEFHFFIYGSETLFFIASEINKDCVEILRNIGIPVVYECTVPISYIWENDIYTIFNQILYNYLMKKSNFPGKMDSGVNFLLTNNHLEDIYIENYEIPTFEMFDSADKGIYRYDSDLEKNTYKKH